MSGQYGGGLDEYEWDEEKRKATLEERNVDFAWIREFEWTTAITHRSDRYGEVRFTTVGYISGLMYHVVFTERGDRTRIISMRRASDDERSEYARQREHA